MKTFFFKTFLQKTSSLEKQVQDLETKVNEIPGEKEVETIGSQTEMECGFPTNDLTDYGQHLYQCQGSEDPDSIVCYLCGWKLKNKDDLIKHRKEKHEERVKVCIYYSKGMCHFDDGDCWYQHNISEHAKYRNLSVVFVKK